MGLFSKKPEIYKELSFNREKLQEAITKVSKCFYECQREYGLQAVLELIRLERNIAMLQIHTVPDERRLYETQARIRALSDILVHIERCILDGKQAKEIKDKKLAPGAVKQRVRKKGKTAGLAI
jgi:hypothetical protein